MNVIMPVELLNALHMANYIHDMDYVAASVLNDRNDGTVEVFVSKANYRKVAERFGKEKVEALIKVVS